MNDETSWTLIHSAAAGDEAARTDPRAAEIVRAYYTRPEEELFDLERDPLELNNLADRPEFRSTLDQLKNELAAWTKSQGDELLPHNTPYLTTDPLPDLMPRKKRKLKAIIKKHG